TLRMKLYSLRTGELDPVGLRGIGDSSGESALGNAAIVVIGQGAQRRCAIARKSRAVHQRQRARCELRKAPDCRPHARVEGGILEEVFGGDRRSDKVSVRQRGAIAELGEEVAA